MPTVATTTARLAEVLATLYPDRASAERVAGAAGMNRTRIADDPRPLNHWTHILAEAQVQGRYDALMAVVTGEYPNCPPLREAAADLAQAASDEPPAGPIDFDWVEIPAGEFLLGSDPVHDSLAYPSEQPQQRVTLPTFYIACVPVTVPSLPPSSRAVATGPRPRYAASAKCAAAAAGRRSTALPGAHRMDRPAVCRANGIIP